MKMLVDPKHCHDNPCIRSRIARDPVRFAELRKSIRESGILQTPEGREHPSIPGDYQLSFGEGRRDAWILEYPGQPLEVDITPLSDQQMIDHAIDENGERADLSIIEKARIIQQYHDKVKPTPSQAAMAARFHYKDQSSVSNVLALLRLPEAVQLMVHRGELPQRHARALVAFAAAHDSVTASAKAIAIASDKDWRLRQELNRLETKFGKPIDLWPLTWPAKPIEFLSSIPAGCMGPRVKRIKISACVGCDSLYQRDHNNHCLHAPCWEAKRPLWLNYEAKRSSRKTGIPLLKPEERGKAAYVYRGDWNESEEKGVKAIKSKHESLRLVMAPKGIHENSLLRVTGSRVVALATVDSAALNKKLSGGKKKAKAPKSNPHLERTHKNLEEQKRLVYAAARPMARVIPSFLPDLLYDTAGICLVDEDRNWKHMSASEKQMEIMASLIDDAIGYGAPAPKVVRKKIFDVAKTVHVKLPADWDKAPAIAAIKGAKGKKK